MTFSFSLSSLSREMSAMMLFWTARKQDHAALYEMYYGVAGKELLHAGTERRH